MIRTNYRPVIKNISKKYPTAVKHTPNGGNFLVSETLQHGCPRLTTVIIMAVMSRGVSVSTFARLS